MIRAQQSSDSFFASDGSIALEVGRLVVREGNDIANSLMRSFFVIMLDVFGNGVLKRRFAKEDYAVETPRFDRSDESLGEGVQIRTSRRQFHRLARIAQPFIVSFRSACRIQPSFGLVVIRPK